MIKKVILIFFITYFLMSCEKEKVIAHLKIVNNTEYCIKKFTIHHAKGTDFYNISETKIFYNFEINDTIHVELIDASSIYFELQTKDTIISFQPCVLACPNNSITMLEGNYNICFTRLNLFDVYPPPH
ncbi:MAG: hypothetical protein ACP5DZ_10865 [Bacteroidales bacterium]